ncbi:uncharacterized protein LOC131298180 isoform X1 [Rhododendron vialii]|uniref:uncharacterized protein LOC131298180 isoform X1 n=1 Tax=Rhododendron vialii TaxID=182163 RepID=UPI00265F1AE8|nr:uncharacterized protein LOC131298180 isoform X1 [Rhododendron vialii]XP_058179498.1 uncharacterized protein LOC131298180 isoform X1 [Rhododendron vialii]
MPKRRAKRTVKQSASSPLGNIDGASPEDPKFEKKEDTFIDQDVDRESAAIRAIRDVEIDHLLTGLRLLRSKFSKEQRQIPVLQFFRENLPDLEVVKNGKDGQYEVQWKDKDGTMPMNQADGIDIHASLLRQMSAAYPDCSTAFPSSGGFEFSSLAARASLLGADNLQTKDFVLEEPSDTQMFGLHDGLQTPGVTSHRMSVGMTPKTLRLPKHGEMLLSVHGSPLGVYKEDNMECIRESEEG